MLTYAGVCKVKEVVCVSRGKVHLKGFTQSIETFVIAGIAGGPPATGGVAGGGVAGGGGGGGSGEFDLNSL
jgi:hypothetical protein